MENNTSNKFIKRIKSITGEGIAVLIVSLIMLIIDIIFIVNLINGINSKQYMFNAKNQTNDIIMLVVFSILLVALLSIIIYNLFFRHSLFASHYLYLLLRSFQSFYVYDHLVMTDQIVGCIPVGIFVDIF